MVTLQKNGNMINVAVCELVGLSTDTKPTDVVDGIKITNGSSFLEMDTSKVYMFSESNTTWYEI